MVLATASNICKSYGIDKILNNISFNIDENDKIGLVGPNGAGKTTLMRIIAGVETFDSGDLFLSNNLSLGYLKQNDSAIIDSTVYEEMLEVYSDLIGLEESIRALEEKISKLSDDGIDTSKELNDYSQLNEEFNALDGYAYKSKLKGVLNGLGFGLSDYDRPISGLSGGEKTRLSLGKILLKNPNLLLLDEPTNHLDMRALAWLELYLKSYKGTLVIISHDRYFLDQTVNKIFEIENTKLSTFRGDYSDFVKKKQQRFENDLKAFEKQNKEIKKQEELITKFKERGTEKLAKRARSRENRLSAVEVLDKPVSNESRAKIKFSPEVQSGKDVLFTEDISKSYDDKVIVSNGNLDIKKNDRVCIVGPNGGGKTTLLKMILSLIPSDTGYIRLGSNVNIGYFDQEQKVLNEANSLIDEIHNDHVTFTDTKVRGLLGSFLFNGDEVFKKVSVLSGGERVRLSLLKLMLSKSNFLIMDEPTNHLDIDSKEIIEDALLNYEGTLLIVSHDRYFLNKIPNRILEVENASITEYLGNYDYYINKKKDLMEDAQPEEKVEVNKTQQKIDRKKEKERLAQERKLKKDLSSIEAEIAETEAKIEEIHHELCEEEVFSSLEKSTELNDEISILSARLEELYEKWEELHG